MNFDKINKIPKTSPELLETLKHNTMYRECAKECSWCDWCPYYKENPPKIDRRCGFTEDYAELLSKSQLSTIEQLGNSDAINYIEGLVELIRFIDKFLERITHSLSDGILNYYDVYANFVFSKVFISAIKPSLDNADRLLSLASKSHNIIFLVEGESEKAFIQSFRTKISEEEIFCYQGAGNYDIQKIHLIIDLFLDNGYSVFLQYDLDKKNNSQQKYERLLRKYSKNENVNFFAFSDNLEQSYTPTLFARALNYLQIGCSLQGIKSANSYKEYLSTLGYNIDDLKIPLATIIAQIIECKYSRNDRIKGEIYEFYHFVHRAAAKSSKHSVYKKD